MPAPPSYVQGMRAYQQSQQPAWAQGLDYQSNPLFQQTARQPPGGPNPNMTTMDMTPQDPSRADINASQALLDEEQTKKMASFFGDPSNLMGLMMLTSGLNTISQYAQQRRR